MDLLNYPYLDKMNNNIGILCYEGNLKRSVYFFLYTFLDYIQCLSEKITDGRDVTETFYTHRVLVCYYELQKKFVFYIHIFKRVCTSLGSSDNCKYMNVH